jgi:hypothetical protein
MPRAIKDSTLSAWLGPIPFRWLASGWSVFSLKALTVTWNG